MAHLCRWSVVGRGLLICSPPAAAAAAAAAAASGQCCVADVVVAQSLQTTAPDNTGRRARVEGCRGARQLSGTSYRNM